MSDIKETPPNWDAAPDVRNESPMSEPENPPAFTGLSMRDWFAGQALLAGGVCDGVLENIRAIDAYIQADAMLVARAILPTQDETDE